MESRALQLHNHRNQEIGAGKDEQNVNKKRRANFKGVINTNDIENDAGGVKKKCAKKSKSESSAPQLIQQPTVVQSFVGAQKLGDKNVLAAPVLLVPSKAGRKSIKSDPVLEQLASLKQSYRQSEPSACKFDQSGKGVDVAELMNISASPCDDGVRLVATAVDVEMEELCERLEWIDVDAGATDSLFYPVKYVNEIYAYLKQNESHFAIDDYMSAHIELSVHRRALLIDWFAELQQSFELTHETLYLAVKLTDLFLSRLGDSRHLCDEEVMGGGGEGGGLGQDRLQLAGIACMMIAGKFEERQPPCVDDYLYISEDSFTREQLITMEESVLKVLNFDLGAPLSYTFARRYAKCARVSMLTLTLTRYILETSLLDLQFSLCRESRLASAALLLAMGMNGEGAWDGTMVHYTGYTMSDISELAVRLNAMLVTPIDKSLTAMKEKYSHAVFLEVAKIATLSAGQLSLLQSSR